MSIRTTDEYVESLRDGREVYARGERVDDVPSHPVTQSSVEHTAGIWELQHDDPSTYTYDVDGERRSIYFRVPRGTDDLVTRQTVVERTTDRHMGVYNMLQALGTDVLFSLLAVAPDVDAECGTNYAERVRRFYERCRDENLSMACAITDPKGDRSKPPHEQSDPDLHLRVVDERDDGVVIRGAKMHNPAPISDEILILPTRVLGPDDSAYAFAGAVRPAADGVRMICRPQPQSDAGPGDAPVSSRHNEVESLTVFDDVFVPNERVFLRGEHEWTPELVGTFSTFCRYSALGHKASMGEHMIGATHLAAKYNGVDTATHVRRKLTEMMRYVHRIRAFARAAAMECESTNDIAVPQAAFCDVGKYEFATGYHRMEQHVQDVAGGIVATAPSVADLENPETGDDVRKFFRAAADGDDRFALATYLRDLTASDFAGWQELSSLHGGGSPEALLTTVFHRWDMSRSEDLVASKLDVSTDLD